MGITKGRTKAPTQDSSFFSLSQLTFVTIFSITLKCMNKYDIFWLIRIQNKGSLSTIVKQKLDSKLKSTKSSYIQVVNDIYGTKRKIPKWQILSFSSIILHGYLNRDNFSHRQLSYRSPFGASVKPYSCKCNGISCKIPTHVHVCILFSFACPLPIYAIVQPLFAGQQVINGILMH